MTTLPEDWAEEGESSFFEPNVAESQYPAVVPVKVVFSEVENLPPGFATFMTWAIGVVGTSLPTPILQRRLHRYKAKFSINTPGACTVWLNSKQEPLTLASPQGMAFTFPAGATGGIISPPIPATGVAQANFFNQPVSVNISGGTVTVIAINGAATGFTSGIFTVPAGGSITLTYSAAPTWVWTGTSPASNAVNFPLPDYDGQPPLYAIASIAGVTIAVMDESFGQVQ